VTDVASYTFHIESRPNGRVTVDVYAEADYPDAASDIKRRARELHAEALADWKQIWAPDEQPANQ
jgi:hypothetical protein